MDEFIKYLLVTDQLDEVFWGKEKEAEDEEVLKRTLRKKDDKEDDSHKNSGSFTK